MLVTFCVLAWSATLMESTWLFQLSTIIELLEESFYGMDLLKLHSITSKLLDRVENIEKVSISSLRWRCTTLLSSQNLANIEDKLVNLSELVSTPNFKAL